MKTRPDISRVTLPCLPWSFDVNKETFCFVLGVSNKAWPPRPLPPRREPVAYKTPRWYRLDILKEKRGEAQTSQRNYYISTYRKTLQQWIESKIEAIKAEKAKGKLRSVHSIAVIVDPHGLNEITIISLT